MTKFDTFFTHVVMAFLSWKSQCNTTVYVIKYFTTSDQKEAIFKTDLFFFLISWDYLNPVSVKVKRYKKWFNPLFPCYLNELYVSVVS